VKGKLEKSFGEECITLDNLYSEYANKYNELKDKLQIDTEVWASSPYYNLYPLQLELSGNKGGKIFKSEPKNKNDVVVYGFINNEINYAGIHDGFSSISLEYIIIQENDRKIILGYYKQCMDRICILYHDDDKKPQHSLSLFIDNHIKRYVKELYEFNTGKIIKIKQSGIRQKNGKEISIIDVIYDVFYDNDCIKEIIANQNNHKSGKINTLKIF
jgi:hypothetical protein